MEHNTNTVESTDLIELALGLAGLTVLYTLYEDKSIKVNPLVIAFLTFLFHSGNG